MSLLHLEESPVTDSNKMDISDATTSLDSAGVSPIAEEEDDNPKDEEARHHNHNDHASAAIRDTRNEDDADMNMVVRTASLRLDNRIKRPEMLPLEIESNASQRQGIERTLANSHPLMSPTSTDSDSEQSHHAQLRMASGELNCHNFPDVVPHSERLQPLSPTSEVTIRNANNIRDKINAAPKHNKLALLRTHSPDLLSSESEADVSQYHAAVESNFQAVALIQNPTNGTANKSIRRAKKSGITAGGAGCDDLSSLDSISNHSFDDDEDLEHNLASLSPSSSLIDGLDDDDDDDDDEDDDEDDCGDAPELLQDDDGFAEAITPTPGTRTTMPAHVLPQYSAAEERRDSRNWQKITLPDGRTREIDMRVIEPYKRVLSHGGYLKAGGHNAIVIFCACHLPDRSRADYNYVMDNLFLYVVKTLEQLVTEDYVLIYLHGGTNRRNVPPFPWLKKCYQLLDRRLRKSLKNMYLVHPTFWIKSIVWMTRPFVSAKFWRKLIYVKSLDELSTHVAVEKAAIPEKVKQYDAKHN